MTAALLRTPTFCCCSTAAFLLLIFASHGAAAPAENANSSPVFNSSSGTAADNRVFARNATEQRQYAGRDGGLLSPRETGAQPVGTTSDASRGGRPDAYRHPTLRRARRHHHHSHHHHHSGGQHRDHSAGGDIGPARQFDNMLSRIVGQLDANTCVSRFVCELVARRGVHSFIGTTVGNIFKGLSHAPNGSPARGLWRAATIGKTGWLPVCGNAYPDCSSFLSTFLSIANVLG